MLGFLFVGLLVFGYAGAVDFVIARFWKEPDQAVRLGIAGLCGIASAGTLWLFLGLAPDGFKWGIPILGLLAIFGLLRWITAQRKSLGFRFPQQLEVVALGMLLLAGFFSLIGVLTPSTTNDWDSIAYHMAIPKIYAALGQIHLIPYISHSNFPSATELNFTPVLPIFGQSAAKAFLWWASAFGAMAIFGLGRRFYGRAAGWWAAVAFAAAPTVIWESGSAYIDVIHGLFAGLGLIFLARGIFSVKDEEQIAGDVIVAGILMGFACGTKYTGLVTTPLALVAVGMVAVKLKTPGVGKRLGLAALVAFLVGGAWYVKNILWVGNPVYPFAYETFHGKNWDEKRAVIYHDQQLTFGVGVSPQGKDWSQFGAAVLGLAYQPGRYVDPMQTEGGGSPLGAVGLGMFVGLLGWCFLKKPGPLEASILIFSGFFCLAWFGLSQQSRYFTALLAPTAILAGAIAAEAGIARVAAFVVVCQAGLTLWMQRLFVVDSGLPVAFGKVDQEDYLRANLNFYAVAQYINQLPGAKGVGLYDQVFGFYLDKPYMWANPPHSTDIPYESMKDGKDYVSDMESLGLGYVYVQFVDPTTDHDFAQSLGLGGPPIPLPPDLASQWKSDWVQRWKPLLVDAVEMGDAVPIQTFKGGGALFALK